nr:TldD/PmbA family protein [Candidatus Eremiobacteraeota bacterium]
MVYDSLGERALDTANSRGAHYADVRFEDARTERIEVRNGVVAALLDSTSSGYGIRALVDGAWGFAAGAEMSPRGVDATAARAVDIARAGAAIARKRFGQPPSQTYVDTFATQMQHDPDDVPLGQRVALLLDAEKLLHVDEHISVGRAWLDLWHTEKSFLSSTGSRLKQSIRQTGSGIAAMAVGDGDAQTRTFPGDIGLYQAGGWEVVQSAALAEHAERIGEEARALLRAKQCPSGEFDVVLGGSQVSLQIHESCGHPAELDRVMGWEANFSGVSFLNLDLLGRLQYGSPHVTIVID